MDDSAKPVIKITTSTDVATSAALDGLVTTVTITATDNVSLTTTTLTDTFDITWKHECWDSTIAAWTAHTGVTTLTTTRLGTSMEFVFGLLQDTVDAAESGTADACGAIAYTLHDASNNSEVTETYLTISNDATDVTVKLESTSMADPITSSRGMYVLAKLTNFYDSGSGVVSQ
jgi:hypothetical protein